MSNPVRNRARALRAQRAFKGGLFLTGSNQIYLILDNVRSAYNVGSIFRTADAAGVKKIFLCGKTPIPPISGRRLTQGSNRIAKTALGAEKSVDWKYNKSVLQTLKKLKSKNQKLKIISLEITPESKSYLKYKFKPPLALVLGSETKGISKNILKKSDAIVHIPMFGTKESFNVSVAFAIVISKIREQIKI